MLSQQLMIIFLVFSTDFQLTHLSKLLSDSFSSLSAAPFTPLTLCNAVDDISLKMSHLLATGIFGITNGFPLASITGSGPVLKISTRVQPCWSTSTRPGPPTRYGSSGLEISAMTWLEFSAPASNLIFTNHDEYSGTTVSFVNLMDEVVHSLSFCHLTCLNIVS